MGFIGLCFFVAFCTAIGLNVKHRMEDERAKRFAEKAFNNEDKPWLN